MVSITVAGCTGSGGQPTVRVRVENRGARTAGGWIDVFHGRTSAPPTAGSLDELDESNNHASTVLNLPDCSFN